MLATSTVTPFLQLQRTQEGFAIPELLELRALPNLPEEQSPFLDDSFGVRENPAFQKSEILSWALVVYGIEGRSLLPGNDAPTRSQEEQILGQLAWEGDRGGKCRREIKLKPCSPLLEEPGVQATLGAEDHWCCAVINVEAPTML